MMKTLPIGLLVLLGVLMWEFNSFRRVGLILATVPLAATSVALDGEARARSQAREEAEQWLAGTDFALHAVQVRGDSIKITINGPDEPPPLPVLAAALQGRIGRPVAVELVTVRSQSQRMPGTRTDGSG